MPLASATVDGLFAKLAVRYGSSWAAKWTGIPIELVKADWAEELGRLGFASLTHGLMNLPEWPPTVFEFKALCLTRPDPELERLPAPRGPLPDEVKNLVKPLIEAWKERKPLQWAYDLQEREKRGDGLSVTQRAAWRVVLQHHSDETIVGAFSPIPPELHPPGGLRAEP